MPYATLADMLKRFNDEGMSILAGDEDGVLNEAEINASLSAGTEEAHQPLPTFRDRGGCSIRNGLNPSRSQRAFIPNPHDRPNHRICIIAHCYNRVATRPGNRTPPSGGYSRRACNFNTIEPGIPSRLVFKIWPLSKSAGK